MPRSPACLPIVLAALLGAPAGYCADPPDAAQAAHAATAAAKAASPNRTKNAHPASHAAPRTSRAAPTQPALDLAAPPVNHVLTPEQQHSMLADEEPLPLDDVEVESGRYREPVPQGQLRAIPWAFLHPLSAWRVFMPVE